MKQRQAIGLVVVVVLALTPSLYAQGHWTRGVGRDILQRVQGSPDEMQRYEALGYEVWKYGSSTVKISTRDGSVLEWDNSGGNLKVEMRAGGEATGSASFTRGSHHDDVLRLQGTPESVNRYEALGYEVWKYGRSTVKVSTRDGSVLEWDNQSGNLKVELRVGGKATGSASFTRGSHQDDVLRLQGTPESVNRYDALGYEVWKYGRSTVKVSTRDGCVLEWDNSGANLKVEMRAGGKATRSASFSRGSHNDDVLRLQGTPESVNRYEALGYEVWNYGRSTVKVALSDGAVLEWDNQGRNLKVELQQGGQVTDATSVSVGVHQDDVIRLLGTPTEISRYPALGYEAWGYERGKVDISLHTHRAISVSWAPSSNTTVREIRYHTDVDGVTAFYDENQVYAGSFRFHDDDLGDVYGFTDRGVTHYFDKTLAPLRVASYWSEDNRLRVVSLQDGADSQRERLASRLSSISMSGSVSGSGTAMRLGRTTFYDLTTNAGRSIHGTSTQIGSSTFDHAYQTGGPSISGSRTQIGNFSFGNWSTSDGGSVSGTSQRIGNFMFHDFRGSDGKTYRGTTTQIGRFTFTDLSGSR